MADLHEIVTYCNQRLDIPAFPDFPGAVNGLQMANNGSVSKIGAAVDAGLVPFQRAAAAGIDFLVVHHGMFWDAPRPWTGATFEKLSLLMQSNLAVYSAHLPLDAHPEIGNNVLLAGRLGLQTVGRFMPFEGRDLGVLAGCGFSRTELKARLQTLFPSATAMEFGSERPPTVAVMTGSGASVGSELADAGVDTLITGELREHFYNRAQEEKLNLYACGHYATEVFGVCALAEELGKHFGLPWEFVATDNPL